MFKHRVNGASWDRVCRASSACVACPDGSLLITVNKGETSLSGSGTHAVREHQACRIIYSSRVESTTKFKCV